MSTDYNLDVSSMKNLRILGMSFHLCGLTFDISSLSEIERLASQIAKYIRYTQPFPKGCCVYIKEISESPDRSGYIRSYKSVQRPYWLPKLLLDDFRELEHILWHMKAWEDLVQNGTKIRILPSFQ
jgi:hypothetical protein